MMLNKKSKYWLLCLLAVAGFVPFREACGETSNTTYEVVVTDSRISSERVTGSPDTIGVLLSETPTVVMNSQGGATVQSDLSIRGSSFSGAGLAVGGLALRNPQTEHFGSDLPLPPALFAPPIVLTGIEQASGSAGFAVGAIGMEFVPVRPSSRFQAGIGENDRNWQDALFQETYPSPNGNWAMGVFAGREEADGLDYDDNYLERAQLGLHVQRVEEDFQADAVLARQQREFGARGYYGTPPMLAATEQIADTIAIVGARWGSLESEYSRLMASWRETRDEYELSIVPEPYLNDSKTGSGAIGVDGRKLLGRGFGLLWRADGETESIRSNRLGDHDRERFALLLMPEWSSGDLDLSAGARGQVFTEDSEVLLPQAGATYAIGDGVALNASYSRTAREPSYTELNYESPGSLGNSGLKLQETDNAEAGLSWRHSQRFSSKASVFYSRSSHAVDWVKETPVSPRWTATDLGDVETRGVELAARYGITDRFNIKAAYTAMEKEYSGDYFAGRYVLDYPEHLLQAVAEWMPIRVIRASWIQTLRWQEPATIRAGEDFGAPARAELTYLPTSVDGLELTLACDNVLDDDFEVFAGQPVAERRFSAAIAYSWK